MVVSAGVTKCRIMVTSTDIMEHAVAAKQDRRAGVRFGFWWVHPERVC